MKTKLAAVVLMGGSMLAPACSMDATSAGEEEIVGESSEALTAAMCGRKWVGSTTVYSEPDHRQYRKYELEASLPGALLNETGRLAPETDLASWGGKIVLTQAAKDKCNARGKSGCPETQYILDAQAGDNGVRRIEGFQNLLATDYDRFLTTAGQSQTGCKVNGQHVDVGSLDDGSIQAIPEWQWSSLGLSAASPCSSYPGVTTNEYKMQWYKSTRAPGKMWCKLMAFGGATSPNGQNGPGPNWFVAAKSVNNGSVIYEGWDPAPSTPAAVTGSMAATASGNVASYVFNGAAYFGAGYVNPAKPTQVHTWNTSWSPNQVRMLGLGCYLNGAAGTYQPHQLYANLILTCR